MPPTDQQIADYYGGPITQAHNPPQEYGVDIGLAAGTPVYQLVGGVFQAALSTGYSAVYKLSNGLYEDYLHLTPVVTAPGAVVPAGQLIGYVSPLTGPSIFSPNQLTGVPVGPFASTGPHLEVGYYGDPAQAEFAGGSSALDPAGLLAVASMSPGSAASPATDNTPITGGIDNFLNGLSNTVPGLGWVTGRPSAPGSPTSGQPPVLGPSVTQLGLNPGAAASAAFGALNLPRLPADFGWRVAAVAIGLALLIAGAIIASRGSIVSGVARTVA